MSHISNLLAMLDRRQLTSTQQQIKQQLELARRQLHDLSTTEKIKEARLRLRLEIGQLEKDLAMVSSAITDITPTPRPLSGAAKHSADKKATQASKKKGNNRENPATDIAPDSEDNGAAAPPEQQPQELEALPK